MFGDIFGLTYAVDWTVVFLQFALIPSTLTIVLETNGCFFFFPGTMVVQVAATDADDPTYGNSARVVYSIIHGQPYFSVEPKTGRNNKGTLTLTLYVAFTFQHEV